MHDAAGVRCREPPGDLKRDVDGLVHRTPASRESRPQGLTFQTLHDEVRGAVVLTHVVHRQHVAVIQRAGCARFLLKAAHPIGIVREVRQQDFDRDISAQPLVPCTPDFAHASRSQQLIDDVRANAIARPQPPPVACQTTGEEIERRHREEVSRPLRRRDQGKHLLT